MDEKISNRLRRIAGAGLAALMLVGCTPKAPTPTATLPTVATQPPTAEATHPTETEPPVTEPPTEPAITEPPLTGTPETLDPVTALQCTRWITFPELLPLGGGRVLASQTYYDRKAGRFTETMQLVDVYKDELVASVTLEGTRELVLQSFHDGKIVTADPAAMEFSVYDQELALVEQFSAPDIDGFFSHDREDYYYIESGVLYRMDVASGNRGRMDLEQELRLESLVSIHPTEDLLVARMYLSAYTDDRGLAVIDASTGKLRLVSDKLTHLWATGDTFYGVSMSPTVYGNDLYIGTFSGSEVSMIPTGQIGDDQMGWSVLPGSHLLVRRFAPDKEPRNTTVFDLKTNSVANLDDHGYIDCTFGAVYLYNEQLIMGFYEEGDYFLPVIIDPKALSYTEGPAAQPVEFPDNVDRTVLDRYHASVAGPELDASLEQVRATADRLEKTYHITVRLAEQTAPICACAAIKAQTATDPNQIQAALETLEEALSQYPENFFSRLRNGAREGGAVFCLTGPLQGQLPMSGFSKLLRDSYIVGLDITAEDLSATIHHELWHVLEMKLSTDTFAGDDWDNCNPEGFKYYQIHDSGYLDLTKWTFTGGSGKDSCFVEPYSRIDAREDRATIWEKVMTGTAEELLEAPALKAKLEIMSEALQDHFPTDDDPLWETYL